ncbi:heavy metal transporter [Methanocella sp. CWC-04]|uniref:Heavy metal transporter n=1 Tax=Methanooceanicella nereidis TaxID=2052831 RepID=A0AAP2W5N1_9EURY|nr:heavy metal-associated domain-containing protein [Methanocella sp. CWC-04]MCD1294267.1 heavy metal transporter [Methanocella sp. CWC-04]
MSAEQKKVVMVIEGMHCGHCAETIRDGLKKVPGVVDAEVIYTTGKSRVTYDAGAAQVDDLVKAIQDMGYKVKEIRQ